MPKVWVAGRGMSWSGPAAGTAQYQPPPFATGQPGYSGSNFQGGPAFPLSGPPQRPPENRPPKKKGNPIITRYPPPPGYRGPAQPQAPYATQQFPNQYQAPPQGYPQGYRAPLGYPAPLSHPPSQGYPPQAYVAPQTLPPQPSVQQNPYPQGQHYQYPPPGYPPNHAYPQALSYSGGQGFTLHGNYEGYPASSASADQKQPPQVQNLWQPPWPTTTHVQGPKPNIGQQGSATNEKPSNPKDPLNLAEYDWDFDFDGAIWPKSNEPVDPRFSLGVIIWRAPKQVTRALPSTFAEAEEQASKPPPEKLGNAESVSIYFTAENAHEAFLDVRQTDEWRKIRKDPIFVVFPKEKDMPLISFEECSAMCDRPDEPIEEVEEDEDEDMGEAWNVMDNLEQALAGQDEGAKSPPAKKKTDTVMTETQEDVLARLGVTGSPKTPSDEPMPFPFPKIAEKPASLPEKPPVAPKPQPSVQRAHSYGGHRNSTYGPPPIRPYGSMSSTSVHSLPPPPPERGPLKPHGPPSVPTFDGRHKSFPHLDGSSPKIAAPESETQGLNGSAAPEPKLQPSDSYISRKRSYEDVESDDKLRQQDDHSRRKRRQPEVASAYSRR